MNRNFATACLLIWIFCYVIAGWGGSNVGPNVADLANKLFWVFFGVWVFCVGVIIWKTMYEIGKGSSPVSDKSFLEKWR